VAISKGEQKAIWYEFGAETTRARTVVDFDPPRQGRQRREAEAIAKAAKRQKSG
jgi:hypothetical protein